MAARQTEVIAVSPPQVDAAAPIIGYLRPLHEPEWMPTPDRGIAALSNPIEDAAMRPDGRPLSA